MLHRTVTPHDAAHSVALRQNPMLPPIRDLIRVGSRRWFLQMGTAGLAGLSLPDLLRVQAATAAAGKSNDKISDILFWLSGGPSHLDMWDPKPEAPREIRGPYGTIATKLPGVRFSEHLPLQAQTADKLSVIRSVDCSSSNHTPITMQAGNSLARRTDNGRDGGGYPSMGSVAAKYRGPNVPGMPGFVGLAESWAADVWEAGELGRDYAPVKGLEVADKLTMPEGLTLERLQDRQTLRRRFDEVARKIKTKGARSPISTVTSRRPTTWCCRARFAKPSTFLANRRRCTMPMGTIASVKRLCSHGVLSKPARASSWSAEPGATSIITATK
jgi:hypothetical protein